MQKKQSGSRRERIREAALDSARTVEALAGMAGKIERFGAALVRVIERKGKILAAGNGGSAAEAMHLAEELVGRFRADRIPLPAVALVADGTAMTCIGNDMGFESVFSRQVQGLGRRGDALVLLSTSGNSPNLPPALKAASRMGMKTFCLLGRNGGLLAGKADYEIIVRSNATERIQEAHQVLIHMVLDMMERRFAPRRASRRKA